jgi:hypothetical protein
MKCNKCGWELKYIPCSFRKQIKGIIGNKVKRGKAFFKSLIRLYFLCSYSITDIEI